MTGDSEDEEDAVRILEAYLGFPWKVLLGPDPKNLGSRRCTD